jgi:hypothetical protein
MGRRRSEIAIVPFNTNNDFNGGLLSAEVSFYSQE